MPEPVIKVLPGFAFDKRMKGGGRYRRVLANGSLGQMVSAETIANQSKELADAVADKLAKLAADAVNGDISPQAFFEAAQAELRNSYNAFASLGKGGWSQMDAQTWGRNGGILQSEYAKLRDFAKAVENGEVTEAQAQARARMYGGKAYSRFTGEDARLKRNSGEYTEERWGPTAGDDRVCEDCAAFEAMGWQPIGTFPAPGDGHTRCMGACRCPPLSFKWSFK